MGDAGDKFRLAVTAFIEHAKADLREYLDLKSRVAAQAAAREELNSGIVKFLTVLGQAGLQRRNCHLNSRYR